MSRYRSICRVLLLHCRVWRADSVGDLVVLHVEASGAARHGHFRSSPKERSDHIPARLSSRLHVLAVVDRSQVGRRRNVYVILLI